MTIRRAIVAAVVLGAAGAGVYWLHSTRRMVADAPPAPALPQTAQERTTGIAPTAAGLYFSFADLSGSATASARGIANILTGEAAANLRLLTYNVLDPLVRATGRKPTVTSGYRSAAVNALIPGSASDSQHMNGEAVDFSIPGMTNEQVAALILRLNLPFDQLIWYANTGHVHVSFTTKRPNRRQVLYKDTSGKYVSRTPSPAALVA